MELYLMNTIDTLTSRYFETRDGRCLPFRQIGDTGKFCIFIDNDCADRGVTDQKLEVDGLVESNEWQVFAPDLLDQNEVRSTADSWRSGPVQLDRFAEEGDVERQARDVLDLADIFGMPTFRLIDSGKIAHWLQTHYPERIEPSLSRRQMGYSVRVEDAEMTLAR